MLPYVTLLYRKNILKLIIYDSCVAAQGRCYVPGHAMILRNRHLAKTTANGERDSFRCPGTRILSSGFFGPHCSRYCWSQKYVQCCDKA